MKLKRLSLTEFIRVAQTTGLTEQTQAMAREVLVDGASQTNVATKYGMTKQRIHLAINTLEKAYFKGPTTGNSIVNVTLDLPENLALELANLTAALQGCKSSTKANRALSQVLETMAETRKHLCT